MSRPQNNLRKENREKKEKPAVKKLPGKAPRKNAAKAADDTFSIDIRDPRKHYASIVELALRKMPAAKKAAMPEHLKPMLATLVDAPFNDDDWQFELKLDGYRTLAYCKGKQSELRSRNNNSFNKKFSAVLHDIQQWEVKAVVDGEIVVLNEAGVPDFSGIQQWERTKKGQLVFYVFDLLWVEGWDIMAEPLHARRALLQQLVPEGGTIRFSDHIDDIGMDFFEMVRQNNLEGIIAKKKNAPYVPDSRSKTWLKIKAEQRHEAIICGYTRKRDTDRLFSSLILGTWKEGRLQFLGQAGTGFSAATQEALMQKMKKHVTKKMPFDKTPATSENPVWLKPFLVCEVKYTELTPEGIMRHPSFQGLREDKAAFELNDEKPAETEAVVENDSKTSDLLAPAAAATALVNIDGHDLKLTNLKKIYWPKEKITKGDMLRYYYSMAEYIMPYMKDRPQSLNRFPNGIDGHSFYHKNMGGKVDKWLNTFERVSESNGEPKDFLICTNTASLIYMANLGCIEMNPWHSRAQTALFPDWCVIDLDPGNISFEKVIETALVVKEVLDALQVPSFPKTSGSTGIHIYIPLGAKYNYEQSRQLAELVANLVHDELPHFTSLVRNPQKRKDKIYIDYLQNRPIQTICAPYSIRPKPKATVSAPLRWEEVKKGLRIDSFTMHNMPQRVAAEGDLFTGVMAKGIDLNKVLKGLSNLI